MYFIVFLFIWIWHGCHDGESRKQRETVCSVICEKVNGASLVWNDSCLFDMGRGYFNRICPARFCPALVSKSKAENTADMGGLFVSSVFHSVHVDKF